MSPFGRCPHEGHTDGMQTSYTSKRGEAIAISRGGRAGHGNSLQLVSVSKPRILLHAVPEPQPEGSAWKH